MYGQEQVVLSDLEICPLDGELTVSASGVGKL